MKGQRTNIQYRILNNQLSGFPRIQYPVTSIPHPETFFLLPEVKPFVEIHVVEDIFFFHEYFEIGFGNQEVTVISLP
jgi:hypothetical protein